MPRVFCMDLMRPRWPRWPVLTWLLLAGAILPAPAQPPGDAAVHWLTFAQLDDSLRVHPKRVFVFFYADWCTYCRKMEREALRDVRVRALLNGGYYAVRMNVETADTVRFGQQVFVNQRLHKPNPVHQVARLMAGRKGKPFSLPAMVVLDEQFKATARYFQYLDGRQLADALLPPAANLPAPGAADP